MDISFVKPGQVRNGALAVFAVAGGSLIASGQEVDRQLGGQLSRAIRSSRFRGETGDMLDVLAPSGFETGRVVIVGVGERGKGNPALLQKLGGLLISRVANSGEAGLVIHAKGLAEETAQIDAPAQLAFGAMLRSYRFDRYRTREPEAKKPTVTRIMVQCEDDTAATRAFTPLAAVASGVAFARDLVSEPANILYPESFAERCKPLGDLGVKVEILGQKELEEKGFGAMLGVAQGSAREPKLLIMSYDGSEGKARTPVALIGKGVTFDTGGISLKPPAGMQDMKWDMGGAGAVAGAMMALAGRKSRAHVVGLCGLVENMPSATAQRPGDVVTSLSGQTIEVINTDAEGRLVLCDVMWYAQQRFKPKVVVDLATLTGAMMVALGNEFGGLFSNDDALAEDLARAGLQSGDKLWRFPLGEAYDKLIDSQIADMKNVGPRFGGSITAAQFLQRYVQDGVKWAHLDIAGTVWSEKDAALWEKGATGYGVRLLNDYIAAVHEAG